MRRTPSVAPIVAAALLLACGARADGPRLVEEDARVPMPEAGPAGLQALLVYPATPGKHPLVLLSHGSPRDAAERPKMTPYELLPQAREFARRGWAAAVVMRRGYGTSGGEWAEDMGPCRAPRYQAAGAEARADLSAAIRCFAARPDVDGSRVLAVGVSAGGFATVALAAAPPPGLVAAISFAGGRGSSSADTVCDEDSLDEAFRAFGASARTPMLWVYAENDRFFRPDVARRFLAAYREGGAPVKFVATGPFGADGHHLFSAAGAPIWTPIVDAFLEERKLKLLDAPLPPPPAPALPAPSGLSGSGLDAWKKYLAAPPHKAFAVSPRGRYGWRTGRASAEDAEAAALSNCAAADCSVVAIDDAPAAR